MTRTVRRRVVIASGDRLFAQSAALHIGRQDGWEVAGIASDAIQTFALTARHRPSCVLVLGDLPRLNGAALAREVLRRSPEVGVVIVPATPGDEDTHTLPFGATTDDVLATMATAPRPSITTVTQDGSAAELALIQALTRRERLILTFLAHGKTRDEIAEALDVSTHTIRTHIQNLYAKLDVHTRLEAIRFASRHGLIAADAPASLARRKARPR